MTKVLRILSFCLFDFANSAYTTVIITVAFNVVFTQLIVGSSDSSRGNFLWSLVLAASWLSVAFLGPWVGEWSDQKRKKKMCLTGSVALCCSACAALYWVEPGSYLMAFALVYLSNLGFSFSENFISSFLPHLASKENVGKISGLAWGIGYFGGLGSVVLVHWFTGLEYSIQNYERLRLLGPITSLFFLCGALPSIFFLKEPLATSEIEEKKYSGLHGAYYLLKETKQKLPNLFLFLISMLFFQGALAIVISFAAIYGKEMVGLSGSFASVFFILLQITAAAGAIGLGAIQQRFSGLKVLNATLWIWIISILGLWALPFLYQIGLPIMTGFFFFGALAGVGLGATQACARAIVAMLSPAQDSGKYFGLWGFSGKLASVLSILAFGFLQMCFSLKIGFAFCILLFGTSLWIHRHIKV